MPGLVNTSQVVRFGVFEVDLRAGELRKKGVKVRLQEQPLRVLAVLLDQRGDIVTREELKQKLWAGTIVDFDHSLNTTINKLRDALGDSADTPRFIETLPRRGYRFICPADDALTGAPTVAVNGAATGTLTVPVTAPRDAGVVRKSRKLLVGLAAVLFALVALNVGGLRDRFVGRATALEITAIAVLPLKNLSGDHQQDYFVDGMTEALITELGKIG